MSFEGADAAFTENDFFVAAAQYVLSRKEPLFDGRHETALQQDRFAVMPQFAEQRVVLHVPRADLVDVAVLADQLDLADVHHL